MTRATLRMPVLLVTLVTGCVLQATGLAGQSSPPGDPLSLTGPAKRYCSGLWVSGRAPQEVLYNSVLLDEGDDQRYESGRLRFDVDADRRVVTALEGGARATARHFDDQGCVILPAGTDNVFFTPRRVTSALPDASTTPWPMGDLLPEGRLPPGVDGELLDQALETFFSEPADRRAAFIVVHRGRIVAEGYGSGAHRASR